MYVEVYPCEQSGAQERCCREGESCHSLKDTQEFARLGKWKGTRG